MVGKISDERFAKMSATYEAEQKALESRIAELDEFITTAKEKSLNAEYFLQLVQKYTDIKELDAEIFRDYKSLRRTHKGRYFVFIEKVL